MDSSAKRTTLNILDYKCPHEQFCCFLCKGYLSCGPIRLLPDGKSLCGRCPSPHSGGVMCSDASVYRNLPLENILRKFSFPCRFRKHGCTEYLSFGQVNDHESKCTYATVTCATLSFSVGSCPWEGALSKLLEHFLKDHSDCINSDAKFKLQLDNNSKEVLMIVKDNMLFIVKYIFDAQQSILKYDIRYCIQESECEVTFKVNLINDDDCFVGLKAIKCIPYDNTFKDAQNAMVLNLKKYLPSLDDPSSVTVFLNVTVIGGNNILNLCLIEAFRCQNCKNYLMPPLFDIDDETVCYKCKEDNSKCVPSLNKKLEKAMLETNFRCRMPNFYARLRKCEFIGKAETCGKHEKTCHVECISCGNCYALAEEAQHFNDVHRRAICSLLDDKITYKISFPRDEMMIVKCLYFRKNDMLLRIVQTTHLPPCDTRFKLIFTGLPVKMTGVVAFGDEFSKPLSKWFSFNSSTKILRINSNDLPSLFQKARSQEFTVTIKFQLEA